MATFFNPNLLSADADPEGSVRYENITILHLEMPCSQTGTESRLCNNNTVFVVCDYAPTYTASHFERFKGTVLAEADGSYSWWRSI